ncbi:MAG TPA: metallophosphoesterase [Oligoflexia bacterium]|nr:metallophosphoesterase [Oligoflexia bacterium]HMP49277.1 metallophosphoesterase [Oligoflexia bacterium]
MSKLINRRNFFKIATGLAGSTLFGSLYSIKVEPYWLEIVERTMPLKNLPRELAGATLMQISDIHIGDRFDMDFIIESFSLASSLNPDFVVYTGDFITLERNKQLSKFEKMASLFPRGKIATSGVLGNHDYGLKWSDDKMADLITSTLYSHDIRILRNEKFTIKGISFIGIDEYWGPNFNPAKALKNYSPQEPTITLCHNPDVCDIPVWNNYSGWILSGHTHGGQVRPPFLPPPILPVKNKRYTSGEFKLDDNRFLYINRALGTLWPVRFNVRPEITLFKLAEA